MISPSVRRATPADVPFLAAMEAATFPVPWTEAAIAAHLGAERTVTLVYDDGGIAGYLFGTLLPPEGEVFRIAVDPRHRRGGVGSQIMQSFLDILEEEGGDVCFLEVRRSNHGAQEFYRSFDFLPVGERKNYYKNPCEDALVLRRLSR